MKWFSNLRTVTKLSTFLGVMLALMGVTAWVGLSSARAMKASFEADFKAVVFVDELARDRVTMERIARDEIIEPDTKVMAVYHRDLEELNRASQARAAELDTLVQDEQARRSLREARESGPEWYRKMDAAIKASPTDDGTGVMKGSVPDMLAHLHAAAELGVTIDGKIRSARDRVVLLAEDRSKATQAEYERSRMTSLGLFLAVVLIGIAFTFIMNRAISTPLGKSVEVLGRVAAGDLTARLDYESQDEVGQLAKALNASLASIASTLTNVQDISTEVSAAANQLAATAQTISAGAQQQAASLEETAASLEEISSTVKQNTDNAQEASQLATSARDAAERGGSVVSGAVAAMGEITKSSKKIADIITTIDEIAFQTNLLALNAAVEAARAGEQGRGFAVVAAEVRTLAQRTGTAAKEIRGLIADSSSKVEVGTQQVNESGKTLEEIVRSVKRVTDMVSEIAAASREQNTGLDQVNTAVTQVDQVTQTNAAQTEELSATAATLSERSTHLESLVAAFELGSGHATARQASPAPARPTGSSRGRAAPPSSKVVRIGRAAPPPIPAPRKVANGGFEEF